MYIFLLILDTMVSQASNTIMLLSINDQRSYRDMMNEIVDDVLSVCVHQNELIWHAPDTALLNVQVTFLSSVIFSVIDTICLAVL